MKAAPIALGLPLLLAAALWLTPASSSGRGPVRTAPAPLAAIDGEVIVRFKADAGIVRKHALVAAGKREGEASAEATRAGLAARAQALGQRVGRALEAGSAVGERVQVVRQRGADAAELARRLAADPDVEWAEPNGIKRRLQVVVPPNDPLYPALAAGVRPQGPDVGQWYLRAPDATARSSIDAEAAWTRGGFGAGTVVVAVLDTGVRFEHPDLGRVATGGLLLDGYDFVSPTEISNDGDGRDGDASDPGDWVTAAEAGRAPQFTGCTQSEPSSWHGTSTASVIAALTNNAVGMAGVAPGVRVLPVRVLGKCSGTNADILAAMRWAAGIAVPGVPVNSERARVISMSLGSQGGCTPEFQTAVNEVMAAGAVVVASAGNSTGEPVGSPANCVGVIGVGALRHAGTKVGFSDLGPQISMSAPGGNCVNLGQSDPCLYPIITATDLGETVPTNSSWSDSFNPSLGTSFSAPLVAGVAALMVSQQPGLSPAQIKTYLETTARPFATPAAGDTVPACNPPTTGTRQLECYCPNRGNANFPQCGAGMLDAGAAVAGVLDGVAAADASPAAPVVGNTITLTSGRSLPVPGRTLASFAWSIVDAGGAISAISGSANQPTVTVNAIGEGAAVVKLTSVDSGGASASTLLRITVSAPAPTSSAPANPGRSGGGAVSPLWLLLLALATLAVARVRAPRRP